MICLKTFVLLGSALELFRKFFGTVRAIFWLWGSFWPLIFVSFEKGKENPPKSKSFLSLPNPYSPCKKKEKCTINQGNPRREKKQGIPKKYKEGPAIGASVVVAGAIANLEKVSKTLAQPLCLHLGGA